MSRRDLSPEDAELWRYVTRNVDPYHRSRSHGTDETPARSDEPESAKALSADAPARRPPARPHPPLVVGAAQDMDRRTARRFKRGELTVDGRLDLHGLTLDQAHGALIAFIKGAHARAGRCVVVVTGKGKLEASGEYQGKIRRETPHWLNQPALRPLVLAVTEARTRDGGTGAFYVLLKRRR